MSFPLFMKKLLLVALLALPFVAAGGELVLTGAGASFPQPVYTRWFERYSRVDASVRFDYTGSGSFAGRDLILHGAVDFGASDLAISDAEFAKSPRTIWQIPTVLSAVAICHNLKGYPNLRIDAPTLAAIYLGKITHWNDPALAALNPSLTLPDRPIVPVHLTESGTLTDIFSNWLCAASPEWKAKNGGKISLDWPVGVDGVGNAGAIKVLRETPNSIGYLELSVAKRSGVRLLAVKNPAGQFVFPSPATVAEAAATYPVPDDFRFLLLNASGEQAYPIGIVTWLMIDAHQADPAKGRKLVEFLKWVYKGDGEKLATTLGFVPLPENVRKQVLARLHQIKF
ncbi:MAG: phosphate ABC transporter substrate-binding protein PstS [Verrucomicrobia bacterium]|nr:phosphate ABC transporter substrate-binding protein PstS [Verrucomicrobiota bacterium]